MRIIELRAENVKRLRAVQIKPEGDVVTIAGRNAQGKSSVLDAIWMALAGAAGAKETQRPIRDGEKQAAVELDLGDLKVKRTWTASGTTLVVSSQDGAHYPSPQTVLDGLIGKLAFDPLAFAEASQKDQLATLLSVVELPFDPTHIAMERQRLYDERTEANRTRKRLEGAISELPAIPAETPDEEVSVSKLGEELALAERLTARYEATNAQLQRDYARIRELEEELERLKAGVAAGEADIAQSEQPDLFALRTLMAKAETTNAAVRVKTDRAKLALALDEAREQSQALSAAIEDIDAKKAKALEEAAMPLAGLSFDDEGVLYKGVPFSQASSSEQLRVSMAIAMALNPRIRVIRITDGSLLDSENMKLISAMASEHDFQVWLERVDDSGEVGITIEDGQVLAP